MEKFKIGTIGFLFSSFAIFGAAYEQVPVAGIAVEICELKNQTGRAAELARIQTLLAKRLAAEIQELLKFHATALNMDRRIATTPELDEYIDKKGRGIPWHGVYTSEAQIWGYMTHYSSALGTSWLPFRWMAMGGGFRSPGEVYGYIPGEFTPTVKHYLEAYPKATRYIVDRNAALSRDEAFKHELRSLFVSTLVSTAFSFPVSGSLTFGTVARIAWHAFQGNLEDYVRSVAKNHAEDWMQSILNQDLNETPQREEIVRKQVETAFELVDPQDAQKIVSMIYSLHYTTRDKLHSLLEAIAMTQNRGGAQEVDVAAWLTPSLEAAKSSQTEVEFFRNQREILSKKCLNHAREAQAIAPSSASVRGLKSGDLAYAHLVKERAECIVNQHYLLMIEMKWLADLGQYSQQVCARMKAAGL